MSDLGSQRLQGRVALVSGGLRGIGLACVERFLAEGAEVVITDLDAPDSELATSTVERLGQAASYVQANVTKSEDWERARATVAERHGKLHILVNNAGTDLTGPVESLTDGDWRRIMSINVDGVFMGTRAFVPMMAESGKDFKGGASIINVSSIMGLVGMSEVSAYNATKGAVRMFTKGIAVEFAEKKMPIRANSLHPGFVVTPLLAQGFQRWVDSGVAEKAQDLVDMVAGKTPIGRLADPSELASAVYFLASEDSSYMTGAELVVDGGWTAQ
ncbi:MULTISPECIES: SDR family NAD(P)-dependent oxidoreductase [Novosphingobium]|uniref:NAD(P)-dependent dehydrogenase, short-chain alcohol dehydrogenase family n=1 Tax=Novosphingobium mathurense TaxID=428990 RepID=A0A1U6ISU3_9SPHN|nr:MULTISPECIES: glucose 1-dehydrogenase [Novosphingobium]CDO38712.1 3-alpha-(or 20-beta)-hydroxysteroid dehydrogenase [Novosphingobium sp. KN65.2]SLK11070.1 NAD(P)-dependent dehydrogenase, short-chain alcohol dehydrogenase family [Novosphingobium mathurense]